MKKNNDLEKLRKHLKENSLNFTVERGELLKVIASMKSPYSLEDLYRKANRRSVIHAKSTLYRSISIFVDAGFIKAKQLPNGRKSYTTR